MSKSQQKPTPAGGKRGRGRPRKEIDVAMLRKLAGIGCTQEEMAAVLGCSVDTLVNNFSEALNQGVQEGRASIRRQMLVHFMKGNQSAIRLVAANLLGWREKQEIDHTTGGRPLPESTALDLSALSTEELQQLRALHLKASAPADAG